MNVGIVELDGHPTNTITMGVQLLLQQHGCGKLGRGWCTMGFFYYDDWQI